MHKPLNQSNWLNDRAYIRLSDTKSMFGINSATIRRLVETKQVKTHQLTLSMTTYNVGDLRAALSKNN
jgi:hypothetical protein